MESVTNMLRATFASYSHNPSIPLTRLKVGLPCKDGHISFAGLHFDHWWRAFKEIMGNPEWAESELFNTSAGRLQNADAIEPLLLEWMYRHTKRRSSKRR